MTALEERSNRLALIWLAATRVRTYTIRLDEKSDRKIVKKTSKPRADGAQLQPRRGGVANHITGVANHEIGVAFIPKPRYEKRRTQRVYPRGTGGQAQSACRSGRARSERPRPAKYTSTGAREVNAHRNLINLPSLGPWMSPNHINIQCIYILCMVW